MRARLLGVAPLMMLAAISAALAFEPVRLGEATDSQVELLIDIPHLREATDRDGNWSGIRIPGFTYLFEDSIGFHVPVGARLVAVPIGVDVTCEVIDATYYDIDRYTVMHLEEGKADLVADLPREPAQITTDGFFRRQRTVGVRLTPLIYDEATGGIRIFTSFKVLLRFHGERSVPAGPEGAGSAGTAYEVAYKTAILNHEQGRLWRKPVKPLIEQGDYYSDSSRWVRVKVESTGVYHITGQELEAAGVDLGEISPSTLRMFSGGGLPLVESLAEVSPIWMRQVPIRVAEGGDGDFGSQDTVFFYGLGAHGWLDLFDPARPGDRYYKSYYSLYNCYWLTWGGTFSEAPVRMPVRGLPDCDGCEYYEPGSFPERVHAEVDNFQEFSIQAEDGWYWQPLRLASPAFPFVKTPSPDVAQDADVTVRVGNWTTSRECTEAYYRIRIQMAGLTVADSTWRSQPTAGRVVDIKGSGVLGPADRQLLNIESRGDIPGLSACTKDLNLAWVEIVYQRKFEAYEDRVLFPSPDSTCTARYVIDGFAGPSVRLFDVTDQFAVAELSGAEISSGPSFSVTFYDTVSKGWPRRYAAVGREGLCTPSEISVVNIADIRYRTGAPYCVITHEDLLEAAYTIADFHGGEVVTTTQIYDEFGWGVPDVTAIRDFLRWRHETGPLAWVLLLGDGSWDLRGYISDPAYPNYVPSYERRYLNPVSGGLADPYNTDDWFGYLEPSYGDTISDFPTVAISRIPASSPEEALELVNRMVDYAANPERGPWQNRVILVGDDDRKGNQECESGPQHIPYCEELSDFGFPQVFEHRKIYLTEYPVQTGGLKPNARSDFLRCLNQGALFTNYVGHGDPFRMAQEEVYNPSAINFVFNGRRRTYFFAASCNVSRFDEPNSSSMAEDLLRRAEGGTIGSFASTHLCLPGPNQALNLQFAQLLFPADFKVTRVTVGEAAQMAKQLTVTGSFNHSMYWSNTEMYALFGDPAMTLASPELNVVFGPAAADTLHRKEAYTFSATVQDESGPVGSFSGTASVSVREAEDTSGYWTCDPPFGSSVFYDYELPGNEIHRARYEVDEAFDVRFLVASAAREGPRGSVHCFVTDGQVSGSGLLDSLLLDGQAVSGDDDGPVVELISGGEIVEEGDTLIVGEEITIRLTDESGVAIKGKSEFIPTVSVAFDDADRVSLTDSVYALGDFTRSAVSFTVPDLTTGLHELNVSAFDNINNLTSADYAVYIGAQALEVGNVVYAYPNPARDECRIIWQYDNGDHVEIDVTIYTVTGRKIWTGSTSGVGQYHEVVWDCTDVMGDPVANGSYLVVVQAESLLNPGFTTDDRMTVTVIR